MTKKSITISDIAREAGVSKTTVSFVLNQNSGRVPISEATKERVMQVVRAHHYQPNPMAQSLTTRKTGSIGFFLSDNMEGGFANIFFANFLNGAEGECRKHGYGLSVGLFNLSCISSFIFPTPVRQRCLDGVILTGYVADEILDLFVENKINCVCIGDYMSHPERICTVALDITQGTLTQIRYLATLGHRRIAIPFPVTPRDLIEIDRVKKATAEFPELSNCEIRFMMMPDVSGNYMAAERIFRDYLQFPKKERPTAIICSDQTAFALIPLINSAGLECPRDISIVSTDTVLSRFATPGITSIHYDLPALGAYAAKLLIEQIQNGNGPLTSAQSKTDFSGEMVIRASTKRIEQGSPRK